jgi:hypothetical protein
MSTIRKRGETEQRALGSVCLVFEFYVMFTLREAFYKGIFEKESRVSHV